MRVAIVGASGMVGRMFLKVLEERRPNVDEYVLFSSKNSAGKEVKFLGKEYEYKELKEDSFDTKFDFALFSAGKDVSKKMAPIAASKGAIVIDNSSAWRMDKEVPLIVPEVNMEEAVHNSGIIANPNCSTIQAVVALKPLHDAYKIKRIIYSTYQAVSGAGQKGYMDLKNGIKGEAPSKFPYQIFGNCLPHIDDFMENGYTKEEMKMIEETKKILNDYEIGITATTVRVPVFYGHSESINVEFEKEFDLEELKNVLKDAKNIIVEDDPENNVYPLAANASGHDEVYVGRIRRDFSVESGINFWCVGDNIRKGAASNAIQIVEKLIEYDK
jgi:aspartate-semialdehyde dehydrogenase